jgi:hypothetical protein
MNAILAGSFGGLVLLAYAYAFTGAADGDIYEAIVILGVLTLLFFVMDFFIARNLDREDKPKPDPAVEEP